MPKALELVTGTSLGRMLRAVVARGDVLLTLEAMKMQNEMKSPKDGRVQKILTSEGSTVNPGDALAVIE